MSLRRSGMGVIKYCTPEGGSGFIANPGLPWLSSFDITQQSPVYDQTEGWLRDKQPAGNYTYYQRFGPPYSVDGGVLPPFAGGGVALDDDQPAPFPTDASDCGGLGDLVLRRSDVVAPLPSITGTARSGCMVPVNPCDPANVAEWVSLHPCLAAGIALLAGVAILGGGK